MPKNIQKRLSLIKIFLMSVLSFLSTSCEDIVLNGAENNGSDDSSCSTKDHCKIFITSSQYTGNIGGVSGADSICASDSNNPGSGTYKALLAGSTRSALIGNQSDWVLQASKEYRRLDGTTVGMTTADSVFDGLDNSMGTGGLVWTGIEVSSTWTSYDNCYNWSSSSSGDMGDAGESSSIFDDSVTYGGGYTCDSQNSLICIEQ